jgi:ribose/xylose/arabinose/galactoside ABC-type transport system permease subunit
MSETKEMNGESLNRLSLAEITRRVRSNQRLLDTLVPLTFLLLLILVVSTLAPAFLTWPNLRNIINHSAYFIILAIGMTFILTGGGIDLSVGSIVALTSVLVAQFILEFRWPIPLAMLSGVFIGAALGAFNGFIIARLKLPDILVTLATMTIFRGFTLLHSEGEIWWRFPEAYRWLGRGRLGDVPVSVILAAVIFLIAYYIYNHTRFGRHTIAIGSNREAARLAGINVGRMKLLHYALLGVLCAIGAFVISGRLDATQATIGLGHEIEVIAIVIIGGTSLFGGKGNLIGTVLGALILAVIGNAVILLRMNFSWGLIFAGFVVLLAISLNAIREGGAASIGK